MDTKKEKKLLLYIYLSAFILSLLFQLSVVYFEINGFNFPSPSFSATPMVIVETEIAPLPSFTRLQEVQYPLNQELISFDIDPDDFSDAEADVDVVIRHNLPRTDLPDVTQTLPLHLLRSGQHSLAFLAITRRNAGFKQVDPDTGYNILHHLSRSNLYSSLEKVVSWMHARGITKDFLKMKSYPAGDTPLHLAVTHPNNAFAHLMIELLLRAGADANLKNYAGMTPKTLAGSHRDSHRLRVIKGELDVRNKVPQYLACAFGDRNALGPVDPVNWLINGSSDRFVSNPRGPQYFDIC